MQDSIKLQRESQFHWLGYCLALLEDFGEYLQEKKPFYCFTNGEKLLLSKSFIVSSSKTPHKSCEGWRWEQENDKHKWPEQTEHIH